MTDGCPEFSVIVCSLNGEKVLPLCLGSLVGLAAEPTHEVIVVDNGSTDATAGVARRDFPRFRLLQTGRNLGFGGGNNVGMRAARGEFLVLLNDDTEVPPEWLARLAEGFARDPKIGAVGGKLLYPDRKTIQHAGCVIHANGNTDHLGYGEADEGQWDTPGEVAYVTGAALAMRRAALEEVGLLDPAFWPIYFEEVDLQRRMAAVGWRIWYEPAAWLVHYESQSQGLASPRFVYRYTRNRLRYLALHGAPEGWGAAWRAEWPFFWRMVRDGLGWPMARAYGAGALRWIGWRLERGERESVERLGEGQRMENK
jgi:GT2 family glycosyltransferase